MSFGTRPAGYVNRSEVESNTAKSVVVSIFIITLLLCVPREFVINWETLLTDRWFSSFSQQEKSIREKEPDQIETDSQFSLVN
ncbi:hypothetical protein NDU88_000319 [Pleurodeles waltl]|uniref:Uncharacterized protein n=1 Tax=Pleurodeles waltl TaxID=8319 RepID=A0AAV7TGT3_PLEWA|nr:hypothetical protein NDU88_000319 [Pleurodeles waltl]